MPKIKYIVGGITPSQLDNILAQAKYENSNGVLVLRDPIPQEVIEIDLLGKVKKISFGEFIHKFINEPPDKE